MDMLLANFIKFVFEQIDIFSKSMRNDKTISQRYWQCFENVSLVFRFSSVFTFSIGVVLSLIMFCSFCWKTKR